MYKTFDYTDTKIFDRFKRVYRYLSRFAFDTPVQIPAKGIRRMFGNTSNSSIARAFKRKLLWLADSYYSKDRHICKKYGISSVALNDMLHEFGKYHDITDLYNKSRPQLESALILELHSGELEDPTTLEYKIQSSRRWTDLQNYSTAAKYDAFPKFGYNHVYDIRSACTTLIYGFARKNGLNHRLPTIEAFLADPATARKTLATSTGMNLDAAKTILTMAVAGAPMGASLSFASFEVLEFDRETMIRLQENAWFIQFRAEIKEMWSVFNFPQIKIFYESLNYAKRAPVGTTTKWDLYFMLELNIQYSIIRYLDSIGARCIFEHDGFFSDTKLTPAVIDHVIKETGLEIALTHIDLRYSRTEKKLLTKAVPFKAHVINKYTKMQSMFHFMEDLDPMYSNPKMLDLGTIEQPKTLDEKLAVKSNIRKELRDYSKSFYKAHLYKLGTTSYNPLRKPAVIAAMWTAPHTQCCTEEETTVNIPVESWNRPGIYVNPSG